jgi:hypothetical protein
MTNALSNAELFDLNKPPYNQLTGELLSDGSMRLTYNGLGGINYALDRSFTVSPSNWQAQVTNSAGLGGVLIFTNTPIPLSNNFWRVHSVP